MIEEVFLKKGIYIFKNTIYEIWYYGENYGYDNLITSFLKIKQRADIFIINPHFSP